MDDESLGRKQLIDSIMGMLAEQKVSKGVQTQMSVALNELWTHAFNAGRTGINGKSDALQYSIESYTGEAVDTKALLDRAAGFELWLTGWLDLAGVAEVPKGTSKRKAKTPPPDDRTDEVNELLTRLGYK